MRKVCLYVLLAASGTLLITACGGDKGTKVSVENAASRMVIESVSASGKIQPETEVKISSEVSGEIIALYVKEGDSVIKGQLLIEINPDLLQSQYEGSQAMYNNAVAGLASAKAREEQANAAYIRAQADFNRQETLFNKKVISQADYDAAKASFESARAELSAAKQNVRAAEFSAQNAQSNSKLAGSNLSRTRLYSPMSGIVSKLSVEKGERVVGTATMSGTELLRIADLSIMQVIVDVNENDIVRLSMGDTALINVDAYPNRVFKGQVTEIANSPKLATGATALSTDEVTNFEVKVKILPESYTDLSARISAGRSPFRPGMSATVDIQTESKKGLTAPIQAVTARLDSVEKEKTGIEKYNEFVFVVSGDSVSMRQVETSIQDNKYILVTSGLKEGETIVESPYEAVSKTLKNGSRIRVTPKEQLFTGK